MPNTYIVQEAEDGGCVYIGSRVSVPEDILKKVQSIHKGKRVVCCFNHEDIYSKMALKDRYDILFLKTEDKRIRQSLLNKTRVLCDFILEATEKYMLEGSYLKACNDCKRTLQDMNELMIEGAKLGNKEEVLLGLEEGYKEYILKAKELSEANNALLENE